MVKMRLRDLLAAVTVAVVTTVSVPARAQALDPVVAGVQASLTTACVLGPAGLVVDQTACLTAVAAAMGVAATLPQTLQGQIGVLIGDLIEVFPAIGEAIEALVEAAGLPALTAGVSFALAQPGPTNPAAFSPA